MWKYIFMAVIIIVILFIIFLVLFNGMVNANSKAKKEFLSLDTYLRKRWELLSSIIQLVNLHPDYEKNILDRVLFLKKYDYEKLSENEKIITNSELSPMINKLMHIVDYYPELKNNDFYLSLFKQCMIVENEIENAKVHYNTIVDKYNKKITGFPKKMIANMFGFQTRLSLTTNGIDVKNIPIDLNNERVAIKLEEPKKEEEDDFWN